MSIYDMDLIEVTNITATSDYGEETEGTPFEVYCQVENISELVNGAEGNEVMSNALIFIDYDSGIEINKGDIVIIKSRFGSLTGDSTEYRVIRADKPDGFTALHWEVWI